MQKNPLYNTSSISFFQYLFAIAVILVHSGRLTSYEHCILVSRVCSAG